MSLLRKCGTNSILRRCGTNRLLMWCPPAPCNCPIGLAASYTVKASSHWREEFADPANNYFDITLDGDVTVSYQSDCEWTGNGTGHGTVVMGGVTVYDADCTILLVLTLGTLLTPCQWNIAADAPSGSFSILYNLKPFGLTPVGSYDANGFNDGLGTYLSTGAVTA